MHILRSSESALTRLLPTASRRLRVSSHSSPRPEFHLTPRPKGWISHDQRATFVDYVKGKTVDGVSYKVQLNSRKVVGICASRGSREYQEDRASCHTLHLSPSELLASLPTGPPPASTNSTGHSGAHSRSYATIAKSIPAQDETGDGNGVKETKPDEAGSETMWDPNKAGGEDLAGQVSYFGIFDGHGGQHVAEYLDSNLPSLIESCTSDPTHINEVVAFTKGLGGYFRRFKGGALTGLIGRQEGDGVKGKEGEASEKRNGESGMNLEERLTLAFLSADKTVLSRGDTKRTGSTASIALLQTLDTPSVPYFYASNVAITIAHCGDTRILLCKKEDGKVEPMTEKHHAESRVEAARLRRLGQALITDSFGETRWMGAIENTRSFGDGDFKPAGVTAEPEVKQRIIDGNAYCYLVFITDGISALMSDQEIVDLARNAHDPYRAAKSIVDFAEDLGASDNCTCMVVPLAGWGKVGGTDSTEERREYRKKRMDPLASRMERM